MHKKNKVRVRFAPSPTGYMHIGNLRTALFNWLFAKHNNGTFLLRIEDTDLERSKPEFTKIIIDTLAWVGIVAEGEPVIQSQNKARHLEVANKLIDSGHAYRCYCTSEELLGRLVVSAAQGESYTRYDERCRFAPVDLSRPFVIRFKIPDLPEISFNDLIRGTLSIKKEQLDDFIIVRSDGSPMFNFVVVVDDADMSITHVIRGEDHISNTFKQILIYEAVGFKAPDFAHLPMILGSHGNRLSKRDAATGVLDYKQLGFLPEALCNYLVRLGWAHGNQEIFSFEELVNAFSLEEVGKKGAIFDIKKLEWMNGIYIRNSSPQHLFEYIVRGFDPEFKSKLANLDDQKILNLIKLYQDRSKTLVELVNSIYSLLDGPVHEDLQVFHALDHKYKNYFLDLINAIKSSHDLTPEFAENTIKQICSTNNITLPELAKPLRIALTGKQSSPGIFELLSALGKDKVLKRLHAAINLAQ